MTPEEALLALRAVATLRTALLGLALYAFARLTVYVWRPLLDRVFVSTSVVRFVPYDASAMGSATVCVDCTHRTLPTLTHHKDGSTPKHLRGDTSTDTVFNALRAGWRPLKIANAVTCNHFDIDGLISAWALIEPLKALEHEDVLRETARIGDFRELRVTRGRGDDDAEGATAVTRSACGRRRRRRSGCARGSTPSNGRSSRGRSRETSTASPRASTRTSCPSWRTR